MSLSIKIAITPKASGQASYEILDLIVVNGRAYLSLKDENTSAVTDTAAWTQITENTYDIAVRLGFVGTETEWLASLSAASEAAAVIALDAAGDANDAATAANAAAGLAQDAATSANTAAANITSTVPWSLYRSRVLANSGVINDLEKLTKLYVENLKLLDNTVFMWSGDAGMKTRTSGVNEYAAKAYDMSSGNRDAVQATEANQPFVGGGIAPNEQRKLKGLTGETGTKGLTGTDIQIASSGTFTLAIAVKWNYPKTSSRIYLSATNYIELTASAITLRGDSGNVLTCAHTFRTDLTEILIFEYSNGAGLIRVNGVEKATTVISDSVTFGSLFLNQTSYNFDGEIGKLQIANIRLSASQIQNLYNFTRLQHPEIEGINIGNQHWATSNYEGVVTGDGTVIPEVQGSANISKTGINYSNLLLEEGWINTDGIFYNDGTSNNYIKHNGSLPIGVLFKISFTISITSGVIRLYGVHWDRPITVSSSGVYTFYLMTTSKNGYLVRAERFIGYLENFVFEEVGWSEMTTAYDSLIFEGVAASTATRLTSAWCYNGNDPLNGAVYGKLYNWYAVQAIVANPPAGWRVPTKADFLQLANYLGGLSVAGGKLKKDGLFPYYNNENVGATNESGFSAIGAGRRNLNGTFERFKAYCHFWTADNMFIYLSESTPQFYYVDGSAVLGHGQSIRLIRNEPVGATERNIETGYITNALGATNLDIPIPFGYQVESVRIDSETNITGLSAKLYTGALTELETLFTAKSVTANVQKVIAADADQSIQQTDAVVRINGTKADTAARFRVWVKITKVVFS